MLLSTTVDSLGAEWNTSKFKLLIEYRLMKSETLITTPTPALIGHFWEYTKLVCSTIIALENTHWVRTFFHWNLVRIEHAVNGMYPVLSIDCANSKTRDDFHSVRSNYLKVKCKRKRNLSNTWRWVSSPFHLYIFFLVLFSYIDDLAPRSCPRVGWLDAVHRMHKWLSINSWLCYLKCFL